MLSPKADGMEKRKVIRLQSKTVQAYMVQMESGWENFSGLRLQPAFLELQLYFKFLIVLNKKVSGELGGSGQSL